MKKMRRISRKIVAVEMAAILVVSSIGPARAGLPVIDASNLSQNIVTAIENVAHTAMQIEQYQTQLRQFENMLRNTAAPSQQIWDSALITMNRDVFPDQFGPAKTMTCKSVFPSLLSFGM